jgi:predicted ATPase
MLTRLVLRNFKGWRDTGDLRLAPITVFFGGNSSGKSSLLQFLLMLRQTAESPDRRRVLHLGDKNTPVELGTFKDIAFNHELSRDISFLLEWTPPQNLTIKDPLSDSEFEGHTIAFTATISPGDSSGQPFVRDFRYELRNLGQLSSSITRDGAARYSLVAENYCLVRNPGRPWPLPAPLRFYGFPDEVGAYFQNAGFTSDFTLAIERQLKRIQYLGPLRTYPERTYIWSGEVPEHVGWRGERAIEALLAAAERRISPRFKVKSRFFPDLVGHWLREMGLLEDFRVTPIAKQRKDYEVLVKTKGATENVTLPDVGFGVSQVLPVIVQSFYAAAHSTVLLEQPEIHLHPRVQAVLADLFIEAVRSRENGEERAVQLIVESHSEHFLRRLQRRVAEEIISPKDVALYFCEGGVDGSVARPLEVNLFGEIENWPDDFFGDEMGELTARMDAASKRNLASK